MDRLAPAILAAFALALLCAAGWRAAARSLIYLVIFEGALRKWAFPSLASELYLLKDVVLVGALSGWAARGFPGATANRAWYLPVGIFALFGLLQALNPAMGSPLGGLFGLKAYVLWSAYPLVLAAALRTPEGFARHVRHVLMVAVPVCLLAIVQSQLPPDHFLNVYAREATGINTFGAEGLVRVTGTFPFLAGYANFLIFVALLLLPLQLQGHRPPRVLGAVVGTLVVGTAFMTGSRWPVFFLALFLTGFLLSAGSFRLRTGRNLLRLLLPGLAVAAALFLGFRPALTGWIERAEGAAAVGDTVWGRSGGEFVNAFRPGVFTLTGDGIGSANNAAAAIGDRFGLPVRPTFRPVEAEPGRVMAELGVVGFLGWYALRLFLIWRLFVTARRLRAPVHRAYALAGAWFLIAGFSSPVPYDSTLGAFYWFAAGLAVMLPRFELSARTAARVAARRARPAPACPPAQPATA